MSAVTTRPMSVVRESIGPRRSTDRGGEMTVARLNPSTAYPRPHGLEAAALRVGMILVAWAQQRARQHDPRSTTERERRSLEHYAKVEAEREAVLARVAITRMI